jgi:hypothetical protein
VSLTPPFSSYSSPSGILSSKKMSQKGNLLFSSSFSYFLFHSSVLFSPLFTFALFTFALFTFALLAFALLTFALLPLPLPRSTTNRFVKKWEFKAFFVYALISIVAYPLTQWPLINHGNPLLVVVVPQYVYSAELIFSSILFGVVIYRMKKSQAQGDLERVTPMINLLIKLIYLLIFFNMNLSISFLIINICELAYDGNSLKAKEDLTLGFWEFLQSVFIINFISGKENFFPCPFSCPPVPV